MQSDFTSGCLAFYVFFIASQALNSTTGKSSDAAFSTQEEPEHSQNTTGQKSHFCIAHQGEYGYHAAMRKSGVWAFVMAACLAPGWGAVEWLTDYDAAQKKAAAEHKSVLINFTGSDWCGWCIKLRREVLDRPAFEQYIADKFVPLEIDVPNNPKRVGGVQKLDANKQLCGRFGVDTFPTLMVVTADGKVAGGVAGGADDMQQVEKGLDAARDNARQLQLAASQQGLLRLQSLMGGVRALAG